MFAKMTQMMTDMKKEIDTLKKSGTKSASKPEQKKTKRTVSVPYQGKTKILESMTNKTLAEYIDKDTLKNTPFPMTRQIALKLFNDYEIAGVPWISYTEQIDLIEKLMKHYKYTKASRIKKLNDMLKYIEGRIDTINKDDKMKKSYKSHRTISLQGVAKEIENRLEKQL